MLGGEAFHEGNGVRSGIGADENRVNLNLLARVRHDRIADHPLDLRVGSPSLASNKGAERRPAVTRHDDRSVISCERFSSASALPSAVGHDTSASTPTATARFRDHLPRRGEKKLLTFQGNLVK